MSIDRVDRIDHIDHHHNDGSKMLSPSVSGSPAQGAVLGFVGCPWTLATYVVEGASSSLYKTIKSMMYDSPDVLHGLLSHLAAQIATYVQFQIDSGADCIQMFDSWGGELPPKVRV